LDSRKLFIGLGFRVCNVIKKYIIVERSAAAKKYHNYNDNLKEV
jgi:hypothetical protein